VTQEVAVALDSPKGTLRGIRHVPERDAGWSAVLLQGYFSSTHVGPARLYVQIGRALAARGVELWRVDPHGVGDSDGDFEDATYAGHLEDHAAVIARTRGRRVLIGHSLGATFALRLAAREPVERVLLVSPSCGRPSEDGPISRADRAELARSGTLERKGTRLVRAYVEAMESDDIFAVARGVACETLIVHGAADEWWDRGSAERLAAALPRARLVSVDGADHNFLAPGARGRFLETFARELGAWL
jgi:pimeloyl-ACP methyl ester carboxylesterase